MKDLINTGRQCPYCGNPTKKVDSKIIYTRSYGLIWYCEPCDAYCGSDRVTGDGLGSVANKELRDLRKDAFEFFLKALKPGSFNRIDAMHYFAAQMGIPKKDFNIAWLREDGCREFIKIAKNLLNEVRQEDISMGKEPKTPYYNIG